MCVGGGLVLNYVERGLLRILLKEEGRWSLRTQSFGVVPIWVGVYIALAGTLGVSGALFYRRVVRLVLLGRREGRFDRPMRRFVNFLLVFVGQRKVVQRVSLRDMSGIGHALIFFGFLSFLLSYAIFIFGDSAWGAFSRDDC